MAALIAANRTDLGVPHALSCRVLGVSESWFSKWCWRPATLTELRRRDLDKAVLGAFVASDGTYGSPRVTDDLRDDGWAVSENTVAASRRPQLRRRTSSDATAPWRRRTRSGAGTSNKSAPPRDPCTWRRLWTSTAGTSSGSRSATPEPDSIGRRHMRSARHRPIHGTHRQRPGQRRRRIVLRHPVERTPQPVPLTHPRRSPTRHRHLDRRLVQHPPPPQHPRLVESPRLRKHGGRQAN